MTITLHYRLLAAVSVIYLGSGAYTWGTTGRFVWSDLFFGILCGSGIVYDIWQRKRRRAKGGDVQVARARVPSSFRFVAYACFAGLVDVVRRGAFAIETLFFALLAAAIALVLVANTDGRD